MEEARRRVKEKELRRTLGIQRKAIGNNSFALRVQDPWNSLEDGVKKSKNPKAFRKAYRTAKQLL